MQPFNEAYPQLAQHAEKIIETAKQEVPDTSKAPDLQTRLLRAAYVKFASKNFNYNRIHNEWNVQSTSEEGRRSVFTATNTFCTCPDRTRGQLPCKHLIALAQSVLKYENK